MRMDGIMVTIGVGTEEKQIFNDLVRIYICNIGLQVKKINIQDNRFSYVSCGIE